MLPKETTLKSSKSKADHKTFRSKSSNLGRAYMVSKIIGGSHRTKESKISNKLTEFNLV